MEAPLARRRRALLLVDEVWRALNDGGRATRETLDRQRSLADVVATLAGEYDGDASEIERDVHGTVATLVERKMPAAA